MDEKKDKRRGSGANQELAALEQQVAELAAKLSTLTGHETPGLSSARSDASEGGRTRRVTTQGAASRRVKESSTKTRRRKGSPKGSGGVYKRGRIWWMYYSHMGEQHWESARTTDRETALNKLIDRLSDLNAGRYVPAQGKYTVADAVDAYVRNLSVRKREQVRSRDSNDGAPGLEEEDRKPESVKKLMVHVRPLTEYLGPKLLAELTAEVIESYIQERLQTKKLRGKGTISPSKVNRETAVLRAALLLAHGRGRIARVPGITVLDEPPPRQGFWSSVDEFERFVERLPDEDHRDLAWCGYWTGWRLKEVVAMPWSYVDWNATPHPEIRIPRTKNREPRVIPIIGPLSDVFQRRWSRRAIEGTDGTTTLCELVFHRNGRPFSEYRRAWKAAFAAAKVPAKTWHDFRRTAVRNMVNAGVPEKVAMEISGHVTRSIFDRYHIVAQKDKAEAFEKVRNFVGQQHDDSNVRRMPAGQRPSRRGKRGGQDGLS